MTGETYAFIEIAEAVSVQKTDRLLREALRRCFGKELTLHRASFRDLGPTWVVKATTTSASEGFEFTVSLSERVRSSCYRRINFPHCLNRWQSWAQGRIMEEISLQIKNAAERSVPPGTRLFAAGTYRKWAESQQPNPRPYRRHAPKGFW